MTTTQSPHAGNGRIHVLEVIGNAIVGGMETCVERLIERLPRERFRFTALCPFDSPYTDRLRSLDVEVLIVPMPDDPPWSSIQTALSLVAANSVDLLHAHLPKAHLLAGLVGRLSGKPVVTTVHGRQLSMLDLEVHRAVNSHLSVVCRQSYFHALGLGVNASHLSCETNGVDTEVFRPRERAGGLRRELGLETDTPLVGFVGRLSPEKGPEVFVRAASQLLRRQPQAHSVFIGEGPMRGEVAALAERLGLARQLHFAGLREDIASLYSELDMVVSSSHSEAMPLALMEAMASGLPVIATRVGGVPDIVEHGQTGWLVAAGDADDIAARCATLVADPALRQRMGASARRRAVDRFDLAESVENMGRLLMRLAGTRAATGRGIATLASVPPAVSDATVLPVVPARRRSEGRSGGSAPAG
ncbi:MAG: glycosyltransferase family 1 protein [Rubrivivax sp.]|nr:MAG: glycosyltransferase family 1 protein [Rubrivivax sp.]